jgi:hypothetical protein
MPTESKYVQRDGLDYAKVTQAAGSSIKATRIRQLAGARLQREDDDETPAVWTSGFDTGPGPD